MTTKTKDAWLISQLSSLWVVTDSISVKQVAATLVENSQTLTEQAQSVVFFSGCIVTGTTSALERTIACHKTSCGLVPGDHHHGWCTCSFPSLFEFYCKTVFTTNPFPSQAVPAKLYCGEGAGITNRQMFACNHSNVSIKLNQGLNDAIKYTPTYTIWLIMLMQIHLRLGRQVGAIRSTCSQSSIGGSHALHNKYTQALIQGGG